MRARAVRGVGLAVALAIFGFLVTTAVIQERLRQQESPARRAELEALIEQRRETIRGLSREVTSLSEEVNRSQERAGQESKQVAEVVAEVEELARDAGLRRARGPGVVVTLSDSPRDPQTRDELTDLRIQDVDLQLVVNALWQSGAEAVAVNGRRVIGTTAIRKAGSAILVNYRAVSSPYRIVALGDPGVLAERLTGSEIASRFEIWRDVYDLGFAVEPSDRLVAPAVDGPQELRWAAPEGAGS